VLAHSKRSALWVSASPSAQLQASARRSPGAGASDGTPAAFRVEDETDGAAENRDYSAELQQRLEAQPEAANLTGALPGRMGVQQGPHASPVYGEARVCGPQTGAIDLDDDPAVAGGVVVRDGVGSVLDEFGDLPIGVPAGEHREFDVRVLFRIVGGRPVGREPLAAKLSRVVDQGVVRYVLIRFVCHPRYVPPQLNAPLRPVTCPTRCCGRRISRGRR
jgi:hypothetical protein